VISRELSATVIGTLLEQDHDWDRQQESLPMAQRYVAADPYPWPFDGDLQPENTALVVIDMQTDFCGIGGYVDRMGYDLCLTRAPIAPIAAVLADMRRLGFHVFKRAKGTGLTSPIFRRTSAGGRGA
jgi:hypothetical protein